MSITGIRDVDEVPTEGTHGTDLPPNMSMSTVTASLYNRICIDVCWKKNFKR